jgi:hypothetical protein
MVARCETKALEPVPERIGPLVELAPGERPARVGDREFFGCATGQLPEWRCRRDLGMRRVLSRRSSANHIRGHVDQIATLTINAADTARRLNRLENVRPIPPSDPDFTRLYPRRNDAESINRNIEDTLWIGRARRIGHARQLLNLLGYALMVNGLALHRHRRRHTHKLAA